MSLKQFVPSLVCLSCEGCCRFQSGKSPWRPKVGRGEEADFKSGLGTAEDILDHGAYVKAELYGALWRCCFLDGEANTCGIYSGRPFECRLYPFLLVKSGEQFLVALHLSCPFAQKYYGKAETENYAAYLKEFFSRTPGKEFLINNRELFSDYREAADEWVPVFELDIAGAPDGA